jgi:GTP cyclohydrolase I
MPRNKQKEIARRTVSKHIAGILKALNYSLTDANFKGTPDRVARALIEEMYPIKATKKMFSTFPSDRGQMILLRDHVTQSRCPHHLERVVFRTTIGYIPDKKVLGLSKLGRIADYFAHGAVLQEQYTSDICEGLQKTLKPLGVGVYVVGNHNCMQMRGIKTSGDVITTSFHGVFLELSTRGLAARNEFMQYCKS